MGDSLSYLDNLLIKLIKRLVSELKEIYLNISPTGILSHSILDPSQSRLWMGFKPVPIELVKMLESCSLDCQNAAKNCQKSKRLLAKF